MAKVLDPETARFCPKPEWVWCLFGRCGHRVLCPIGRLTWARQAAFHEQAADMQCEACRSAAAAVGAKGDVRKDFPDDD